MNRNSLALLILLVLIGIGAYAAIDWQRGHALPPEGLATKAASSGGLVINSVVLPGESEPLAGTPTEPAAAMPAMPAMPASGGADAAATCP